MNAIEVHNVKKTFESITALEDINIEIKDGELFGFIGPDGAGKTTLFRILTTLLIPDTGTATVLGFDTVKDYKSIRNIAGYMPGRFSLYQDLSVEENLEFFATIFGTTIQENYSLISDIYSQLEPFKKRRAGQLSGGMKQKLALCCALIHKPKVLFLDEPTTGVDPVSREEFWGMLDRLKDQGITIVVSTPYMNEASLCDRVALIQKGKLLSVDTPDDIVKHYKKTIYGIKADKTYQLIESLLKYEYAESVYPFGEFLHYTDKRNNINPDEIKKYLEGCGLKDIEIEIKKPDIEDVFMYLMKQTETANA
ncbi:MAG: ABC transporter ATP-binding protein [Ignavibacteriae bacterium]|nr:ABC transporter ATP-binding protein [Ignavibacteriota bacterium]